MHVAAEKISFSTRMKTRAAWLCTPKSLKSAASKNGSAGGTHAVGPDSGGTGCYSPGPKRLIARCGLLRTRDPGRQSNRRASDSVVSRDKRRQDECNRRDEDGRPKRPAKTVRRFHKFVFRIGKNEFQPESPISTLCHTQNFRFDFPTAQKDILNRFSIRGAPWLACGTVWRLWINDEVPRWPTDSSDTVPSGASRELKSAPIPLVRVAPPSCPQWFQTAAACSRRSLEQPGTQSRGERCTERRLSCTLLIDQKKEIRLISD